MAACHTQSFTFWHVKRRDIVK